MPEPEPEPSPQKSVHDQLVHATTLNDFLGEKDDSDSDDDSKQSVGDLINEALKTHSPRAEEDKAEEGGQQRPPHSHHKEHDDYLADADLADDPNDELGDQIAAFRRHQDDIEAHEHQEVIAEEEEEEEEEEDGYGAEGFEEQENEEYGEDFDA